jgi:beta-glucosidase
MLGRRIVYPTIMENCMRKLLNAIIKSTGNMIFLLIVALVLIVTIAFARTVGFNEVNRVYADYDKILSIQTDYENEDELVANDMDVCRRLEEEGAALLVNKNNTLPLAANTKFSLFSQSAADPVLTGTGSAFMATGDAISLYGAEK